MRNHHHRQGLVPWGEPSIHHQSAIADPADTRPSEPPRNRTARLHPRRVQEGHRDARTFSAARQVVVVGGQTGRHLGKYRSQADPHAEQCTFPSVSARLLMCAGQEQPRGVPFALRLCRSGGASQSWLFQPVLIGSAGTECARDKRGQAVGRFHQSRGEYSQSESTHDVPVGCADRLRLISICVSRLAGTNGLSQFSRYKQLPSRSRRAPSCNLEAFRGQSLLRSHGRRSRRLSFEHTWVHFAGREPN